MKILIKKFLILLVLVILIIIGYAIYEIYFGEQKVPILAYHDFLTEEDYSKYKKGYLYAVKVEEFEKQMKFLHDNNYKTLSMDEFYCFKEGKCNLPRKSVLITIDDGLVSIYKEAYPILKKYGINATVFVINTAVNKEGYLTNDMISNIKNDYPNIEFHSHSYDLHRYTKDGLNTRTYTYEQLLDDVTKSKEILKSDYFCYPHGAYNDRIIKALKTEDYKLAFVLTTSNKNRRASREDDNYTIPRINIDPNTSMFMFYYKLNFK